MEGYSYYIGEGTPRINLHTVVAGAWAANILDGRKACALREDGVGGVPST